MKTEEQEYIKRILGGEMELYGYFLDTYGHRIFTLVQQMVSNREDAEDITQDIFVKAYESLKRYRGDCEFITWIYRIACNVTASILRKNKQRQEYLSFDGKRLQREKARKEHRTEIWGLITISVISLALVVSVGIILYFYDILLSKENVNDILLTIKRNFKLYLIESLPYYGLALLAGILLFADYLWRKHWYNSRRKASDT